MPKLEKPKYIDVYGGPRFRDRHGESDAMSSPPPFVFENVTCRVFPIKANLSRLVRFCNQYLNMDIPSTMVHFRPAVPYVYMMVMNYGSMSPAALRAQNTGWVSQHEVTFTVPLEQWQEQNGHLVFQNWAFTSPFIFVDDELSLTTGREVYGWPKTTSVIATNPDLWAQDPRTSSRVFVLETPIFPRLYAGRKEEPRELIKIDLAPRPMFSVLPPDPNNPWNPIQIVSNAAQGLLRLSQDAAELLLGLPIRGYGSDRSPETIVRMLGEASKSLPSVLPNFLFPSSRDDVSFHDPMRTWRQVSIEQITLKQFRDAAQPTNACYQALISSPMGINRMNACGLLGDLYLLRGDPSGGFTIRLYRYSTWPIIETLGLEIAATEEGSSDAEVALLKPTFPFWTDADLYYGKGRVLCSCTKSGWTRKVRGVPKLQRNWTNEGFQQGPSPGSLQTDADYKPLYNELQGGGVQPVSGPFRFPDATYQVFPLLADRSTLIRFLDQYINNQLEDLEDAEIVVKPFGSYVYMTISTINHQFGTMWSETNNIGWWADKDVSFNIPVKIFKRNTDGNLELLSLALVCPFAYGSTGRAVITDREINGRPTLRAEIKSPPDAWLDARGPSACRSMLELKTEVFPALNVGQKSDMRTLIAMDEKDPVLDDVDGVRWQSIRDTWGIGFLAEAQRLDTELARTGPEQLDTAVALAVEILAQRQPINIIYLKQFRDAELPEKACYQAYIKATKDIFSIISVQEINQPQLNVRIYKYPSHPIVETLGLVCKAMDSKDGVTYVFQPIGPFFMRLRVNEDLSQELWWRSSQDKWENQHPWFSNVANHESPYFEPNKRSTAKRRGSIGRDVLHGFPKGKSPWAELKQHADQWLLEELKKDLETLRSQVFPNPMSNTKRLSDREKRDQRERVEKTLRRNLTDRTRDLLDTYRWDFELLKNSEKTGSLFSIVEELAAEVSKLKKRDVLRKSKRVSDEEARKVIEKLDDVQLLIQVILRKWKDTEE